MAQVSKRLEYGFESARELCRYALAGATDLKSVEEEAKRILYDDVKLYNRLVDQLVIWGLRHCLRSLAGSERRRGLAISPVVDDGRQWKTDIHGAISPSSTLPKGVSGETLAKSHQDGALKYMSEPLLDTWFGSKRLRDLVPTDLQEMNTKHKSWAVGHQQKSRFFKKLLEVYRAKEPKSRRKKVGEVLTEHDCQKVKKEAGWA